MRGNVDPVGTRGYTRSGRQQPSRAGTRCTRRLVIAAASTAKVSQRGGGGVEQNIRAGKLYHVLDCAIKGVKLGAQRMAVLYALSTKGAGSSMSLSWMAPRPTGPGCHCDGEGGRGRSRERERKEESNETRARDEVQMKPVGVWRYASNAGAQQPGSCAPKWVGPLHYTTVQSALEFESLCIANRPHSLPDAKLPECAFGAPS